jgi:hypothetical protein
LKEGGREGGRMGGREGGGKKAGGLLTRSWKGKAEGGDTARFSSLTMSLWGFHYALSQEEGAILILLRMIVIAFVFTTLTFYSHECYRSFKSSHFSPT